MLPEHEQFLSDLYHSCFWKLHHYALVFLNQNQAEEIVQDTFHDAVKKIDELYGHENPSGWLMQTLKNKMRNYQRALQRELLRTVSINSPEFDHVVLANDPKEIIEREETSSRIMMVLKSVLSNDERYILRRIVFENATHSELATELGITTCASQKRLERIRDKLDKVFPGYRKKGRGDPIKNCVNDKK